MGSRTHVAVVVDRVQDYQVPVIQGVESVLRAADVALLVVVSHPMHSRRNWMINRLLAAERIDGVLVTGMTDPLAGPSRVVEIVGYRKSVPFVTVGVRAPGIPALLPDNRAAVRAVMNHLLDDCGRSRPLLVAGPPNNVDSQERAAAFLEVAAERRLKLPDTAVVHANFEREPAYRRILELLAEGLDFDAVVAANDHMALGVMDALNEHGRRIPEDVAVVGFDNTVAAYRTNPPLSSVDAQLGEQGQSAARLLLAQLDGISVPAEVRLPAPLVIRRSSLIVSSELRPAQAVPVRVASAGGRSGDSAAEETSAVLDQVLDRLIPLISPPNADFERQLRTLGRQWLVKVIDGTLAAELGEALETALCELVDAHPEELWWHQLTTILQTTLAEASPGGEVTAPIQAGILRMALHTDRALAVVREQRYRGQLSASQHVLELNRALSGCRSRAELAREISAYLPRLNVRRCFLVIFDRRLDDDRPLTSDPPSTDQADEADEAVKPVLGRLALSYRNGARDLDPDGTPFDLDQLLPPSMAGELDRDTLIVQPLFNDTRWFGTLLLEQSSADPYTGEALRRDASERLDSIDRAEELRLRAVELEAVVTERTEQLEREVASRQMAQESLREANDNLRRALLLDGLTGLQNRPSFDDHLIRTWHRHLRSSEPLSLLMVDVDHFKLYNDTYGHLDGDKCLRRVAACLQAAVTRNEDIVARYGGEEFAVILPDTDPEGAQQVAERLLSQVRAAAIPHSVASTAKHTLTVSVGIGCSAAGGVDSLEKLLSLADRALYAAKRNGRDQVMGGPSG